MSYDQKRPQEVNVEHLKALTEQQLRENFEDRRYAHSGLTLEQLLKMRVDALAANA